jgi:hypothetical protein
MARAVHQDKVLLGKLAAGAGIHPLIRRSFACVVCLDRVACVCIYAIYTYTGKHKQGGRKISPCVLHAYFSNKTKAGAFYSCPGDHI